MWLQAASSIFPRYQIKKTSIKNLHETSWSTHEIKYSKSSFSQLMFKMEGLTVWQIKVNSMILPITSIKSKCNNEKVPIFKYSLHRRHHLHHALIDWWTLEWGPTLRVWNGFQLTNDCKYMKIIYVNCSWRMNMEAILPVMKTT